MLPPYSSLTKVWASLLPLSYLFTYLACLCFCSIPGDEVHDSLLGSDFSILEDRHDADQCPLREAFLSVLPEGKQGLSLQLTLQRMLSSFPLIEHRSMVLPGKTSHHFPLLTLRSNGSAFFAFRILLRKRPLALHQECCSVLIEERSK
jgi:hypothetical protein